MKFCSRVMIEFVAAVFIFKVKGFCTMALPCGVAERGNAWTTLLLPRVDW